MDCLADVCTFATRSVVVVPIIKTKKRQKAEKNSKSRRGFEDFRIDNKGKLSGCFNAFFQSSQK